MMTVGVSFAGFGGQGVLFAGKVLAQAGLIDGYEVTFMPSYGPETRGGTSFCAVVISDSEIASPLVASPDYLVAMNQPSFDKYAPSVADGGAVVADSSLVKETHALKAGSVLYTLDATTAAEQNDLTGLAGLVLLGKLIKLLGIVSEQSVRQAMEKSVSRSRAALIERNLAAIAVGMGY